jgi:AI-2 transport protein TqsA
LLTFLLNFIPFIGSFLAIIFPVLLSFLQFSDPLTTLVIGGILVGNQILFGNFIEPRMVGKSLNLSPLVVVLALAFWGAIWGVVGMFLCVPITVTLMIIMSQFPKTKATAIMLSAGEDFSVKKGH